MLKDKRIQYLPPLRLNCRHVKYYLQYDMSNVHVSTLSCVKILGYFLETIDPISLGQMKLCMNMDPENKNPILF